MSESNLNSLLEAVRNDDVNLVSMYLLTCQEFFEATAAPSTYRDENPFLVACKHGSLRSAEQIARNYRQFLRVRYQEGYTALHLACSRGDLPLVELLLKLDSELCFEKDKFSMIPLQTAISFGYTEVISTLIAARPESVRKLTPQRETLFHLAAKHHQSSAFEALLEEVKKLKQEHLLHRKDRQGNNVLHIAASNKLIGIVKLLLPADRAMVRVNTLNKKRLTALDVYYQNSKDISTRDIGRILCEAGGLEGRSLPMRAYIRWTLETKNVILVVLGIITGAAFTTVCSLPKSFVEGSNSIEGAEYHVTDVLFGGLPHIFYLMVFNTAILIVCVGAIVVLLWSLPFRPVVLFVTISVGIVYCLLVNDIMPKFSFTIGNHRIFSFPLVALFAVAFICFGAIAYYAFSCLCRLTKWGIRKTRDGMYAVPVPMIQ
ncbi:ankyrin repeat-containing protein, putative [Ricinus communis]|uniref:Ankyrin repeat-containing protein, putative n=1 Tax=Ricinus communis TaxID=3988 RepID=B9R9X7_RICCO|nr:ankyrin repeat-containing protein, putative [Ricinus communis]|eukprot:XP_002511002.1 ankyrin repeat-containing protein BDA1 [Ricinus communis]